MPTSKILYHYTSPEHMQEIIASGYIKRSPSSLLKPRNLQIVGNAVVDPATDGYKPVVWMTDSECPARMGVPEEKHRIRFSIPMQNYYAKWIDWAKRNNMDPGWRKALTLGMNWQSWYISEYEIPLEDVSEIYDTATNQFVDWRCEHVSIDRFKSPLLNRWRRPRQAMRT